MTNRFLRKSVLRLMPLLGVLALGLASAPEAKANFTLTHQNSTFTVNPDAQAGAFDWVVDGVDQLFQQWFWFRIGPTGGESSINTISAPVVSAAGRVGEITYTGGGIIVDVLYTLTGGTNGSQRSDVAETIQITNTGTSAIDFHFFQYSDFDLNGSGAGQSVRFPNANAVQQFGNGGIMSETVITPVASHHQGATFSTIRDSLNDANPTTLNDTPAIGDGTVGPGDMTWAFEWDVTIAAGNAFQISKDKNLTPVPEPSTVAMALAGAPLLLLVRLRRRLRKPALGVS
jgi:hypothetical protein